MALPFEYGIGVPSPLKVVYDGRSKLFKTGEDVKRRPPRFALTSADLKLKLYFTLSDRMFCGLECRCGPLASLSKAEIVLPTFTDGYVKIPQSVKMREGVTYVVAPQISCRLDEKSDIALISFASENVESCFKIGKNLILGADAFGNLQSFYILL